MALLIRDACTADVLEARDDTGSVVNWRHRRHFGLYARQFNGSAALTLRDEAGELVCIVGLWEDPHHALAAEAWFAVGGAFGRNRVAAFRALRRMLDVLGERMLCGVTVRAHVGTGNVAAARLARWLGFTDDGLVATGLGPRRRYLRRFV